MTDMKTPKKAYAGTPHADEAKQTAKKILNRVLMFVPALVIFGLFALYYIQLSHMA